MRIGSWLSIQICIQRLTYIAKDQQEGHILSSLVNHYYACPKALRIKLTTFGLAPFAKVNSSPRLYISGR